MSAKVCPRCGAIYQSMSSATCPQCFAVLKQVDDGTAQELLTEKAKEESSEEFQKAKEVDNERWAEQSFQACLTVAGITLVTVVVCVAILALAIRHQRSQMKGGAVSDGTSIGAVMTSPALQSGPSTAATPDELLPALCGPYRRTELDLDIALPGRLDNIVHGSYRLTKPTNSTKTSSIDVFVIRQTSVVTHRDAFLFGCTMAAHMGRRTSRPVVIEDTENWEYAVIGDGDAGAETRSNAMLQRLTASEL